MSNEQSHTTHITSLIPHHTSLISHPYPMLSISYDSTFDGFLSVVFEIYRQHLDVGEIHGDRSTTPCNLFMQPFRIETSEEEAARLKRAIEKYASADILELLHVAFRSEEEGI